MTDNDIKYWVGFNLVPGIGPVKFGQIEKFFPSLEYAWQAPASELKAAGLPEKIVTTILDYRDRVSLDDEMEKLVRLGIKTITYHDEGYPARLREIYDFPPMLYIKGELTTQDEWCLAVVGTRRATAYGRQVTEEIVADLSRSRITIVSGLAKGIDSIAHRSALEAGGRTVAVLGSGLDTIYPYENTELARRITEQGALLTEYPLGTKPRAEHFPRRNRIISGLSLGVLVTEAGDDSGALITVGLALEQNREVFSVPGSIFSPSSKGTNNLIQQGAKLVSGYTDILAELNLGAVAQQITLKEVIPTSDTEALILSKLGSEPMHIDEICRASGLTITTVSSTLAMMELKGLVKQVSSMNFVLARGVREELAGRI
ncbi:MAG: DNA-processing protein DprA [Chloroflexota bacterium]